MFGDPVGGPHPPLLSPGTEIHPLFGPRALAVAPPHEGYQRADHPLVSGITALRIQGDPQAGVGLWIILIKIILIFHHNLQINSLNILQCDYLDLFFLFCLS